MGYTLAILAEKSRLLDKHGKILHTVSPQVAAQKIVDFLNQDCRMKGRRTLLIAHNGRNFDEERFINFLKSNKVFDSIEEKRNLYFGDSLPACRKVLKNKVKSKSLGIVYRFLFNETFEAHDALSDVVALRRICCNSSYSFELIKEIKTEAKNLLSVLQDIDVESQKKKDENDLFRMRKLKKTSKKLVKSICSYPERNVENIWDQGMCAFFGRKNIPLL